MGNSPSEIHVGEAVCTCSQQQQHQQSYQNRKQAYQPNQQRSGKQKKAKDMQGASSSSLSAGSIPPVLEMKKATADKARKKGKKAKTCDDLSILMGGGGGKGHGSDGRGGRIRSYSLEGVGTGTGSDDDVGGGMVLGEISCNTCNSDHRLCGGGGAGRGREPNLESIKSATSKTGTVVLCSCSLSADGNRDKLPCDIRIERELEGLSLNENSIEGSSEDKEKESKSRNRKSPSVQVPEEGEELELPKDVVYYGWFFTPEVSSAIKGVVMDLFRECFNEVSQFERFLLTCCKDDDVKDPFDYYGYKRPGKRIKPDEELAYHITAKFLGREPDPPYQSLVHSFIGKTFRIHLCGIVFTPRTLGVRARLTSAQQLIMDEKDGKGNWSTSSGGLIIQQLQNELESYNKNDKDHKRQNPNCKLKPDKNGVIYKGLETSSVPVPGTTSRAHITIGCARNVIPKQTGDDLVDIVDLEQRSTTRNSNFQQDFQVKDYGTLRQFGRHAEAFVFYPSFEMIVPGSFNFFR